MGMYLFFCISKSLDEDCKYKNVILSILCSMINA